MSDIAKAAVRLDRWLWAARIYKTRQLAIEAINAGHVGINGDRAKPAKILKLGDEITVRKPPYQLLIVVNALSEQRGAAVVARGLFRETTDSMRPARKGRRNCVKCPLRFSKEGRPNVSGAP